MLRRKEGEHRQARTYFISFWRLRKPGSLPKNLMFTILGGLQFPCKSLENLVHRLGQDLVPLVITLGIGNLGRVLIVLVVVFHLDILEGSDVLANGREVLRGLISR